MRKQHTMNRRHHRTRIRVVAATVIASGLAATVIGSGSTVAAPADAEPSRSTAATGVTPQGTFAAPPAPSAGSTGTPRTVEHQSGIVMEGSGALGGAPVAVTVYENSVHGSSIQVVLGDPDAGRIGYLEQPDGFVKDGWLFAEVRVDGRTVTLSGSVVDDGRPQHSTQPVQDAGEQIVSRGTRTPLATDVTLRLGDDTVPLAFAPAFAYDLEVQHVDLSGGPGTAGR